MKELLNFLSEKDGTRSHARLNSFLITICVLFLLSYIVIVFRADLSFALIGYSLTSLGLKVWQKDKEGKVDSQ